MNLVWATILLLLSLVGVILREAYFSLPLKELKRRAANHNPDAKRLYQAAAYGSSLRAFLWLYIGLTSAASFILLARNLPFWLSLLIIVIVLWLVFSLLPATQTSGLGRILSRFLTPAITWLLNYLHPLLDRATDLVDRHYNSSQHTGIYEREDLLRLIKQQLSQNDNRLTETELLAAEHALKFNELKVADTLTSRRQIKSVLASDTIGPVVIDELHKNGQAYAVVRESSKGPIVGILSTGSLGLGSSGQVKDVMYPVYYLHEDDSLNEALKAFSITNHPVFIVINSFEEYVGVISIDTIIEQLTGKIEKSGFDSYSEPASVAARYQETPVNTDAEMVE